MKGILQTDCIIMSISCIGINEACTDNRLCLTEK